MVEQFRRYWAETVGHMEKTSSGQTFSDILKLRCHLDLECSNPIFFHRTLRLMMSYYQTKFGCKRTNSLEDIVKNSHILSISALTVTLTLQMVNHFFRMTHCLIIIHLHTKFGKKWLSGSGDTERTRSDSRTGLQTDGRTDGQSDSNITPSPFVFIRGWGWGWGWGRGITTTKQDKQNEDKRNNNNKTGQTEPIVTTKTSTIRQTKKTGQVRTKRRKQVQGKRRK